MEGSSTTHHIGKRYTHRIIVSESSKIFFEREGGFIDLGEETLAWLEENVGKRSLSLEDLWWYEARRKRQGNYACVSVMFKNKSDAFRFLLRWGVFFKFDQ